jgi:putative transposase
MILHFGCPVLDAPSRAGRFGPLSLPKGLHRRQGLRLLHFITCSCYRRLPLFASARSKNLFVKILGEVRDRHGFPLAGYVVMPNPIQLLIGEPAKGTPSTVMQVLKQRASRHLRRKPRRKISSQPLALPFPQRNDSLPQFWQPRFYDFNVWSQSKFVEKLQYMHMNPVKRKLVTHPKDGPWSRFSFYAKKDVGLVRMDSVHGWELEIKVKNHALEKTSRTGHPKFYFKGRANRQNVPPPVLERPALLATMKSTSNKRKINPASQLRF